MGFVLSDCGMQVSMYDSCNPQKTSSPFDEPQFCLCESNFAVQQQKHPEELLPPELFVCMGREQTKEDLLHLTLHHPTPRSYSQCVGPCKRSKGRKTPCKPIPDVHTLKRLAMM